MKNLDPNDDQLPRKTLWELMPRRSVFRVVMLLLLLAAVISFQRNAVGCAKQMSDMMLPPAPPAASPPPRVRMPAAETPSSGGQR